MHCITSETSFILLYSYRNIFELYHRSATRGHWDTILGIYIRSNSEASTFDDAGLDKSINSDLFDTTLPPPIERRHIEFVSIRSRLTRVIQKQGRQPS